MPDVNNKITKNSFSGGRNSDVNVAALPPDQYISAHNVDFLANGNFYGLQNINSSTKLAQFVNDPNIKEIGSAPCKFTIDGVNTYCIIYFTMSSTTGTYNIWTYDTQSQVLYALYEELYGAGYNTPDRCVDIINYPEGGIDHVYFTDAYNEVRQLTCIIDTPWVPNSLTAYDLALQQRGSNGTIALVDITSGGSLLTGTYQFAYRMCDPSTKKFAKWSYITNPVHVYDANNTNAPVHAGIGLIANRRIILNITPSAEEIAAFPFIQLAVIENIAATPATTVSLQEFVAYTGGASMQLTYASNTRVASTPIDGFVIDPAQILSAKTLRTTNNRLFLGNITYANLEFDSPFNNGIPAVSTGTIIGRTSSNIGSTQGDSYSSDKFSSMFVGYFRNELYRFGVVYKDKYGNRSYVSPLDMRNVVDNQATALSGTGEKDMKFPSRSFNKKYTLFNSNGQMQGLGLSLSLQNHPTWAVEMEIVRVPRNKNILFQTPLIPMMSVDGTGAIGNYPSKTNADGDGGVPLDHVGAQPMTAGKVYVPKNMFWPEGRDLTGFGNEVAASGSQPAVNRGEVYLNNGPDTCNLNFSMLFPTANMYEDNLPAANGRINTFIYTGSEKVEFVDQALLKLNYVNGVNGFTSGKSPYVIGEDINTNITGNFYALLDGDYYFDSNWAAKTPPRPLESGASMTGYQFYDNFGVSAPVSGQTVMDYPALSTKGYTFGYEPSIQRSAVASFAFSGYVRDPTESGVTFANGVLNSYGNGGGFIVGASGARYQARTAMDNSYLPEPTTYNLANNSYCTAIDIVNITLGLTDNRYGGLNSLHTYQSTAGIFPAPENIGVYAFSDVEQTTLKTGGQVTVSLQVWGGDCFVAAHTFKICDSTYSATQSGISRTPRTSTPTSVMTQRWGVFYRNTYNYVASIPVAVQSAPQYVTVVLESEYNGTVRDREVITPEANTPSLNGVPIMNNATVSTARTPLSYRYNFNLSRPNYQKVYSTQLQFSFEQFKYPSRVAYSNIKIYNSDVSGFDTFSIADYYDLPEQRYAIFSLAVSGDMLYALQERGVVYLPTSGRQIEQSDASTLAVTSGDVIGRPVVISTERGTQHMRAVQESGNMIFMTDNKNKEFYVLAGTELQLITQNQQTVMKQIWNTQHPENSVKGVYDFVNEQWLIALPSAIQVFDQARNVWVGDYEGHPHGGSYQRGIVYMTSFDGVTNNFCIFSLYTEPTVNVLFGNTVDPRVMFAVNPDEAFSKTFDVFMIDSSDKLASADLQVVYDTSSLPNNINGLNLAVPNIENNYRIPLGKDTNGYRLRGMRMLVTAHWGSLVAQLKSIFTKYRYSKRTPF